MAILLKIPTQVCLLVALVGCFQSTPIGQRSSPMNIQHYDLRPYVNEPGRHNLVLGTLFGEGQAIDSGLCKKAFEFLQEQSCTFCYNATSSQIITAILVRDNWDDDTGGIGELISGGPYEDQVVVKITSQFGRGIYSYFQVYGVDISNL